MLAEVAERCRLDAVESVAEVDLVEIHREDLVLRELTLEARSHEDLGDLPAQGLVGREEALSRELLRERAPALRQTPFHQVVQRRTAHPDDVDAAVIVEALILDGEDGVHQALRDT